MGYYQARLWVIGLDPRRIWNTVRFARDLRATQRARRREPRLTVAVDISAFWEPLTGIGWYLYRLLEHLAHRDDLRLRLYGPSFVEKGDVPPPKVKLPVGPALEVVSYRVPENLSFVHYYLADRLRASTSGLIAADGNEILFAPNYFLPPWFDRCGGRLVATVHDLSVYRVPETMRESTRLDLEARLSSTLERATRILTDSQTVREELLAHVGVPAERVTAVHLGPGSVASVEPGPLPKGTPSRYALFVGTLEPRKNLPVLFAAWRVLRDRGVEAPPLVLCGGLGWKAEVFAEDLAAGAEEGWLHHFGYLADGEVAALYHGAQCVVLPSLYEGFGLPVVEAMGCGIPLVCSDIPVLREVAGEAALYAPVDAPELWADELTRLWTDEALRVRLGRSGRVRSKEFSWPTAAAQTAEVWAAAAERAFPPFHSPVPRSNSLRSVLEVPPDEQ